MSTTAVLTRNDACPCGSGRKVKRCHPRLVGVDLDALREARRIAAAAQEIVDEHLAFFEAQPGYMPPPDGSDGWSRENWKAFGCPFVGDEGPCCNKGTEFDGRCGSPSCGV